MRFFFPSSSDDSGSDSDSDSDGPPMRRNINKSAFCQEEENNVKLLIKKFTNDLDRPEYSFE